MTEASAPLDYDEAWRTWADMRHYGPMSRHTRRLIWSLVRDLTFKSVLDVGCGEGSPLEEIARRRPEVELAGVDISSQAVAFARRRLPTAMFSVLDLTTQALDRTFDLVVCSDVLEHIPDDRAVLRNIRAMSNRWCVIGTLQGRMRNFERSVGHVRNYRKGELRRLMEEAGFAVRREVNWGFPFYSPLYRDLLEITPSEATTGTFGPGRRLLSTILYYVFLLNSSTRGDYVFCIAEAR